jgi:hypothetical protein
MNALTTTCTSAMIRSVQPVFSEKDYGYGVLYRTWIDIDNVTRLEQCFPKFEENGQPRKKRHAYKRRAKGQGKGDRDSGPNIEQSEDPNDQFRHNDNITAVGYQIVDVANFLKASHKDADREHQRPSLLAGSPFVRIMNLHFRPKEAAKPELAATICKSLIRSCVKYEARLLTGEFNQAGQFLREYLSKVQMTMEMMHQDSGACNTTGRRFTFDFHYASDQSSEIALTVFNYPDSAHPKWKFKQHDIVELMRAEDIDLIKPEDGDTHNPIWGRISVDDGSPTIKASSK